ncbi:ATP-NAD/AcoX kinase [Halothermothrix orenii H 168]|uniref:NAD kinase n=2 Tax=Halothermothrix orenii TaxID=31909 RepID=B8D2I5_HALOH|nr:NAD(+)/NADH kinase [Halothermothrix orenii]ACL69412.1 ATP-NAD/AcoX kinase [Halothermothrix orenii H 168]
MLEKRGLNYRVESQTARALGFDRNSCPLTRMKELVDLVFIFGGDGTLLHTAHHFIGADIPLLGVNLGRLGFLAEVEGNELSKALEFILEENYKIEKRMLLEAKVYSDGEEVYRSYALNDVVINRGARSRMVSIQLYINHQAVTSYRADGLIIATTTGSTAYSLSAGGPIVNPKLKAMVVTPICPHTLYIRPMVVSEEEKLKVTVEGQDAMMFTADGQYNYPLSTGDEILISASNKEIKMVKLPDRNFYSILHQKMKVGLV